MIFRKWLEQLRGPQLLVGLCLLVTVWFFADRVAGLWQKPFRSAIVGLDNTFYYLWLRAPLVRGDVDFRKDLLETNTMSVAEKTKVLAGPLTSTGYLPNKYPVGWALSGLPWYGMGSLVTHLLNAGGANLAEDGYGPYYQFFLFVGQLLYAWAGLSMAVWLVRKWVPGDAALYGVLFVWLGSFLFYYQTSNLSMSHNLNFFAQMAAYVCAYQLSDQSGKWRYWVGLGLGSALVVLARYQSAVLLVYPVVQVLRVTWEKKCWGHCALCGLTFGLGLIPQLLAWKILYGQYLLYSYQSEGFNWYHPRLGEVLFSPWHGLFYWHPFLLVAAIGFGIWAWSHRSWVAASWLVSIVLTTAVNACWGCWWFGSAFGLRAFDGCLFFGMLGCSHLWRLSADYPWTRKIYLGVALILIAWNLQLAWLARKDWLNMEQPVTHQAMWQTVEAFWTGIPASEWRKTH